MEKVPFVLFGATGDLASRMVLPAAYWASRSIEGFSVIGVARSELSVEEFRERVRASVVKVTGATTNEVETFLKCVDYVAGDYANGEAFKALREKVSPDCKPIFYLAIPPSAFELVVNQLDHVGFARHGRIMLEKPFGRDHESAKALSVTVARVFEDDQVYRIDHFLGKEAVQNLLVFRFANSMLEPIWNRDSVARIELSMLEADTVAGRAQFYDEVGVVRDVVQNHLMQILCLLLMEAPNSVDSSAIAAEQLKVLSAIESVRAQDAVLGQYDSYRDEHPDTAGSDTPTFAALRLRVRSWRWAGVPIFIRTGKALGTTATYATIEFHHPPVALFGHRTPSHPPHRDRLLFHFKPDSKIVLDLQTKARGSRLETETTPLEVVATRAEVGSDRAYAQLIEDVVQNDHSRFASASSVDEAWRVVDPLLVQSADVTYKVGSSGPKESLRLVSEYGGWCKSE